MIKSNTASLYRELMTEIEPLFFGESSGHDINHSIRVCNTAMKIAENYLCDETIVLAASLLHDTDDVKLFRNKDDNNARYILKKIDFNQAKTETVLEVIHTVSFRGTDTVTPETIEGKIVQDADRLDALGAIGIARSFAYGGSRGRCMYDPKQEPRLNMSGEEYINNKGTTVNHFYEKLFLLKDMMNTPEARKIAEERETFMKNFMAEFYREWNCEE